MKILGGRGKEHLSCKCGEPKNLQKNGRLGRHCGKKECYPLFGRKRPNHSALMKEKARREVGTKYANSLMQRGRLHNPNVNTESFRKQIAINAGFDSFGAYMSARVSSRTERTKATITRYSGWEQKFKDLAHLIVPEVDFNHSWFDGLSEVQFNRVWKRLHGISTIRSNEQSETSARYWRFKSERIENLKHNTQGLEWVKTRSSWETAAIKILEAAQVPWSYEEFNIDAKEFWYVPDLVVRLPNETIMIEIKGGAFFKSSKEEYLSTKAAAGASFCKERGWKYCIVFSKPIDITFIENATYLTE